jgi:hypothetical protein
MSNKSVISLRINELEKRLKKSFNQLGLDAGLGNATVDGWTDKQIEKSTATVEKFLRHYSINERWWKTGEGEIFITPAINSNNSDETAIRGHVYTDLIERNSEYKLMPTVILANYKIVPNDVLESHRKEIAGRDNLIAKYEALIDRMENDIKNMRLQFVPKHVQK